MMITLMLIFLKKEVKFDKNLKTKLRGKLISA